MTQATSTPQTLPAAATVAAPATSLGYLMKLLLGPLAFAIIYLVPLEGLEWAGRVTLATFCWMVVWWIAEPVPWAITCLLPLAVLPLAGAMRIEGVAALYGQNIFFWIWGTTMLGYAMEKHGLARRFALWFLSQRGVANSTARLTFTYMLGAACISAIVSDAAVVAMMIPIAISLFVYIRDATGAGKTGRSPLAAFLALGTLYGSQAGGVATIAGIPHNALSMSLLEKLNGRIIGWFEWMMVGVPLMVTLLVVFWLFLRYFFPPEITAIPGGEEFVRAERAKLGPLTRGEVNVMITFVTMVVLFTLPSFVGLALGDAHPIAARMRTSLPIWIVPVIVLFLLYMLPVDVRRREMTVTWKDSVAQAPWNIMILCMAAVGMADALGDFGFMEFVRNQFSGLPMTRWMLPYVSGTLVAFTTNVLSGLAATSLLSNIFIPIAADVGFNTASMAMLVPNVAIGLMFPWSGATAGTAFASGYIDLRDMIRVGFFATLVLVAVAGTIHLLFSGIL
jgi:sodium-dependent dicarboxylate transporter 2/3/5